MADFGVEAAEQAEALRPVSLREAPLALRMKFSGASSVDEADGDAVGDEGAEFFHQVQGQRRAAVSGLVHEAEEGVEADGMADAGEFFGEDGVAEGEEGVDGVAGGTAVASAPIE